LLLDTVTPLYSNMLSLE